MGEWGTGRRLILTCGGPKHGFREDFRPPSAITAVVGSSASAFTSAAAARRRASGSSGLKLTHYRRSATRGLRRWLPALPTTSGRWKISRRCSAIRTGKRDRPMQPFGRPIRKEMSEKWQNRGVQTHSLVSKAREQANLERSGTPISLIQEVRGVALAGAPRTSYLPQIRRDALTGSN